MKFKWLKFVRHVAGTSSDATTRVHIAIDYVHVVPVTPACEEGEKCNEMGHWRSGFSAVIYCGVTQTTTCVSPFPSIAAAKRGAERVARRLRTYGSEQAGKRVDAIDVDLALAAWATRFAPVDTTKLDGRTAS